MNKSPIPLPQPFNPAAKNVASKEAFQPLRGETVHALQEFGDVLRQIHKRLVSEGYIIKDGKMFKPESNDANKSDH